MKFIKTKTLVRNNNNKYYGLYYTVFKNKDEKELVHNQYENDYFNFNDIVHNQYIGRKINKF